MVESNSRLYYLFFSVPSLSLIKIPLKENRLTYELLFDYIPHPLWNEQAFKIAKIPPSHFLIWLKEMCEKRGMQLRSVMQRYNYINPLIKTTFNDPFERALIAETHCLALECYWKFEITEWIKVPLENYHHRKLISHISPFIFIKDKTIHIPSQVLSNIWNKIIGKNLTLLQKLS